MNQKIKQLQTVLRLEEQKVLSSLTNYTKANQQYLAIQQQYQQLIAFRKEYYQRLQVNPNDSLSAQLLQTYARFIAKLDCAIEEQLLKQQQARKDASEYFQKYLLVKQKAEGLKKVLDAEIANDKMFKQKQEQKQTDESASKQWYSNRKE